jgi:hypothetical protein
MPSTISAGTTAGTAIAVAGDTTGNLAFQTNGTTTAMTITTSQQVGIGDTSPTQLLSLRSTNPLIKITDSDNEGIAYIQGSNGSLQFFADDTNVVGSSAISFAIDGTQRANIDSNGNLQFNSGYGSVATGFGCRAWVNFSGQGGAASIRASGNVSSVTENASSDYTINFTSAMPNTNYAITSWARGDDPSAADVYAWVSAPNAYAKTTSTMRIRCGMQQNGITYPNSESSEIGIAAFR